MHVTPVTVSVIVPAFNASATISRVLEALAKQTYSRPIEVIVVDDGSTDNTASIVSSFPAVHYVRQENAGPAAARNHGARLARGEYLAFTDSDCIAHEDWIFNLMEGFAPQGVGVVAGSYGIANPESRLARCVYQEILWRHSHLMPEFPNAFGSYNFCVKKNVFEAVGGFNTMYRHASGEDNDLSYKIIRSGWQIYFQRKALVDHFHPTAVPQYMKEQFRHGFWRVALYRKHPGMAKGDGYTYWKDILEVPWSALCVLGLFLSAFYPLRWGAAVSFLFFSFLMFELLCALFEVHFFFDGIFYGFVLFLRAFARMLGFSTGVLSILLKKKDKIF